MKFSMRILVVISTAMVSMAMLAACQKSFKQTELPTNQAGGWKVDNITVTGTPTFEGQTEYGVTFTLSGTTMSPRPFQFAISPMSPSGMVPTGNGDPAMAYYSQCASATDCTAIQIAIYMRTTPSQVGLALKYDMISKTLKQNFVVMDNSAPTPQSVSALMATVP